MDVYYAACLATIKNVTKQNIHSAHEQLETIIASSLKAPLRMPEGATPSIENIQTYLIEQGKGYLDSIIEALE